ncbi:hypothetical protein Tco_0275793 [Tanacetum coccineum]
MKTQLSMILPEAISNVAAPMIQEALSMAPVLCSTGKSHSSTHKTGKFTSAGKSAPREAHDVQLDMGITTFVGMSKADNEVPVDPKPKRTRPDWYPRSPTPKKPDPDWNTTKTIDDDEEQPWFKEMINAEKPPLTFDELMRAHKGNSYKLDWINPKGYDHPVDMTKPLPLQEKDGRLIISIEVFFNNDLEYLKGRTQKGPTPRLSPRLQLQDTHKAMVNSSSKHIVFSKQRILSVLSVQVEKKFGYGYLNKIVIKRADQKQYTIKEEDFPDLHPNDIKDMLLLLNQNKLWNLDADAIIDLGVAL